MKSMKSIFLSLVVVLSSGIHTALGEALRGRGRVMESRTEVFVKNDSDKGLYFKWKMESHPDLPDWIHQSWTNYIRPGETERIGMTEGDAISYKYWLPWFDDIYDCNRGMYDYCKMNFAESLGEKVTYCVNKFSEGLGKCDEPAQHVEKRTKVFVKNNSNEALYFNYYMESHPDSPDWLDQHWTKFINPGEVEEIGTTAGDAILYKYWLPWWKEIYRCNDQENDMCTMNFDESIHGEKVTYCVNEFSDGLEIFCVERGN